MAGDTKPTAIEELIRDGALLINDGYRAKNSELSSEGIPFARAGNINDGFKFEDADRVPSPTLTKVGNKRSLPGDVVFTSKGTVGRFAYVREDTPEFVYSPQLCFWRALDASRIHSRWLYYWMNGREFFEQFKGVAGQTDMAEYVSLRDQRAMRITLPPLPEQKAIARILGTLDDKIELNRRMNATLEAMARALFQSWFVDFDPVRRKSENRKVRSEKNESHDLSNFSLSTSHFDHLFPSSFQDSGLGEIPDGWTVGKLGDVATNPRHSVKPNEIEPNTPYIALQHMPRRSIALGEWDSSGEIESGKTAFQKGQILFGKLRPYFHKVGVAPVSGVCSTDILVLSPANTNWFGFVLGHASSDALIEFADKHSTGTKMPRTNWKDLSSFKIALPPPPIAKAFTNHVQPLVARMHVNLHQSRTLATLRDTLLPKLLSGSEFNIIENHAINTNNRKQLFPI